jgi:hypothetical protein
MNEPSQPAPIQQPGAVPDFTEKPNWVAPPAPTPTPWPGYPPQAPSNPRPQG